MTYEHYQHTLDRLMPKAKPPEAELRLLTTEDHHRLAAEIKSARALLADVLSRLRSAYGATPKTLHERDNLDAARGALSSLELLDLSIDLRRLDPSPVSDIYRGLDVGALAWARDDDGRRISLAVVEPQEPTLRTARNTV